MKHLLPLLLAVLLSLAGMSIRAYVGDADTIVSPDASVRFGEALAAYLSGDRALLSFLSFAD